MQFGNIVTTRMPTAFGDFNIHVLPELIELGYSSGQRVAAIAEHYALTRNAPEKPQRLYLHQTSIMDDVFFPMITGEMSDPQKILKRLGSGENGALLYTDIWQDEVLNQLQATVDPRTGHWGAAAADITERFREHLDCPREVDTCFTQTPGSQIFESKITLGHGVKIDIKRHDEVVDVEIPVPAFRELFPAAAEAQIVIRKYLTHYALAVENRQTMDGPYVRVHSSCATGDISGAHTCDCGPQFKKALEMIIGLGGAVIYHHAEGRGVHSLAVKMHFYRRALERGLDTYEAMESFGYPKDCRDYTRAADLLRQLGMESVVLLTNNPEKQKRLELCGIHIAGTRDVHVHELPPERRRYLETKCHRGGHRLSSLLQPKPGEQ